MAFIKELRALRSIDPFFFSPCIPSQTHKPRSFYNRAAILAAIACTPAMVKLDVGGCHPSSMGSLSSSKRYLMSVAFPLPSTRSPNADSIRLYSSSDGVWASAALNSGFVAAPNSKRAFLSAAATANWAWENVSTDQKSECQMVTTHSDNLVVSPVGQSPCPRLVVE
jgi:hypothetical protein